MLRIIFRLSSEMESKKAGAFRKVMHSCATIPVSEQGYVNRRACA